MRLVEFISKLQQFHPELTVAIADWSEEYSGPSEQAANEFFVEGNSLVIGSCDHCWHESADVHSYDPQTKAPRNGSKCCVCGETQSYPGYPKAVCRNGSVT